MSAADSTAPVDCCDAVSHTPCASALPATIFVSVAKLL